MIARMAILTKIQPNALCICIITIKFFYTGLLLLPKFLISLPLPPPLAPLRPWWSSP